MERDQAAKVVRDAINQVVEEGSQEPTTEEVITRIMNMVDDRGVDDEPATVRPQTWSKQNETPSAQPTLVKHAYPATECWHFDHECKMPARHRLHMKCGAVASGVEYVHKHQREYPHMNQLCDRHFNDPSYYLQRVNADRIERI